MQTIFEGLPALFVETYDPQFRHWAANYKKIGRVAAVRLKKPLEPIPFAKEQRRIIGVRLTAEIDLGRMVVRPQTEADAEAIARHCFDLRAAAH